MNNNKFILVLVIICLISTLTACSSSNKAVPEQIEATITGIVTYQGVPEEGVQVSIPELEKSDTTDSEGSYQLSGIPGGTDKKYNVLFQKEGRINEERQVLVNQDSVIQDIELDLPTEATITGVVTYEGVPEEGVEVSIPVLEKSIFTDSQGSYQLSGIPGGIYTIVCSKEGKIEAEKEVPVYMESVIHNFAFGIPTEASITGVVTFNGVPEEGVQVSIPELEKSDTTDSEGSYQLSGIPGGTYNLLCQKDGKIGEEREITVINETVVNNMDFSLPTVDDAKALFSDIRNTGNQINDTVASQVTEISSIMNEDLVPYMNSFFYKLSFIEPVMELWNGENPLYNIPLPPEFLIDGDGMLIPGQYFFDEDEPILNENYMEDNIWVWDIRFQGSEGIGEMFGTYDPNLISTIRIELTNVNTIDGDVDLTEGIYKYTHTITNTETGDTLDMVFEYTLNCDSWQIVVKNPGTPEEYTITIPDIASINQTGYINDGLIMSDDQTLLQETGYSTLDGTLEIRNNAETDSNEASGIQYTGEFECEILRTSGRVAVYFPGFLDYQQEIDIDEYMFMITGGLEYFGNQDTKILEMNNGFSIRISRYPDGDYWSERISMNGDYQYYGSDDSGQDLVPVFLGGILVIDPDYSNYDSSVGDFNESNYIGGNIKYQGVFDRDGFEPFNLDLLLNVSGYKDYSSNLSMEYNGFKFLEGDISLVNSDLTINAYNQRGIELNVALDLDGSYGSGVKVGNITNTSNSDIEYAEIFYDGFKYNINYSDGTGESL